MEADPALVQRVVGRPPPTGIAAHPHRRAPRQRPTEHVLLAEDGTANQRSATLALERLGLTVVLDGEGRQALAVVLEGLFSVILMGVRLPRTDGFAATRALRSRGCRTPVLGLVAAASRAAEPAGRAARMDGYLTRPFDGAALTEAVDALADATVPKVLPR